MTILSTGAGNLNWLVNSCIGRVPGLTNAVVVSPEGLAVAASSELDRPSVDRLATVASGLIGLSSGATDRFSLGAVKEIVVQMERGFLFVKGISDGSLLVVLAEPDCDAGMVAYEMAVLAERAGVVLTPEIRDELRSTLPL